MTSASLMIGLRALALFDHISGNKMRILFSLVIGLIFIGNIAVGAVVFNFFLNGYDTGQFSHDGWYVVAAGGIFFGCLALTLEMWLYHRYEFWPQNLFLFFGRIIVFSVLYIALSFAVSSGVGYAISELLEGTGLLVSLQMVLIIPFMAAFYSIMIVPFGMIVGIVNGILLMINHLFFAGNPT
jgi:hypothetical protein